MDKTLFLLVISGTDSIKHQGISAAGANHEMLRYTAALDAEFIYHGRTKTLDKLPVSPNGIVSPALISKACLNILNIPLVIIDAGTHIKPQCPFIQVKTNPANCITSGVAMTLAETHELFHTGRNLAAEFTNFDELIIAECVVGGTTTGLGLLTGLGYNCIDMISSSFPAGNHALKKQLIEQGLAKAQITKDPLSAVAALGDPMQALVAGLVLGSKQNITLAGGTQMIAVGALINRLDGQRSTVNGIKIITTPWVVNDQSAQFTKLHQLCCPEIEVQYADTKSIRDNRLLKEQINSLTANQLTLESIIDRYEEGHVKEGVGMGALMNLFSI